LLGVADEGTQRMTVKPLDSLLAAKVLGLMSGLTANDRRVATVLLDHFNRRTERCDPGLERIAALLGISERTVMRANRKLEAAGLFRKTRHGGYSNRNSYEPNWVRFAEFENAWRQKLKTRSQSRVSNVSSSTGQPCHLPSDRAVTQTCTNNLSQQTCPSGHPIEARQPGGGFTTRNHVNRSLDAARVAAERRWHDDLLKRFRHMPITYGEAVEAIDQEIREAATDAELKADGAGLAYVIRRLRLA
jgi:Mn-dependent DtxR family transcriptional regulator